MDSIFIQGLSHSRLLLQPLSVARQHELAGSKVKSSTDREQEREVTRRTSFRHECPSRGRCNQFAILPRSLPESRRLGACGLAATGQKQHWFEVESQSHHHCSGRMPPPTGSSRLHGCCLETRIQGPFQPLYRYRTARTAHAGMRVCACMRARAVLLSVHRCISVSVTLYMFVCLYPSLSTYLSVRLFVFL